MQTSIARAGYQRGILAGHFGQRHGAPVLHHQRDKIPEKLVCVGLDEQCAQRSALFLGGDNRTAHKIL